MSQWRHTAYAKLKSVMLKVALHSNKQLNRVVTMSKVKRNSSGRTIRRRVADSSPPKRSTEYHVENELSTYFIDNGLPSLGKAMKHAEDKLNKSK